MTTQLLSFKIHAPCLAEPAKQPIQVAVSHAIHHRSAMTVTSIKINVTHCVLLDHIKSIQHNAHLVIQPVYLASCWLIIVLLVILVEIIPNTIATCQLYLLKDHAILHVPVEHTRIVVFVLIVWKIAHLVILQVAPSATAPSTYGSKHA